MRKSTGFLLSLCGLFLGILLGFFFAPIRKGIQVVSINNNGDGNTVDGLPAGRTEGYPPAAPQQ